MKKERICLLICIVCIVLSVGATFAAFNPFVTLKIENIDTTNYIVDLLVDNSKNKYVKANDEDKKEEENDIFQNIQKEYDEWVLANYYGEYVDEIKGSSKDPFLSLNNGIQEYVKYFRGVYFGQYVGNDNFYHEFYGNDDGTGPAHTSTYKIILINKDTGEIKISNEINWNIENKNLTLDAKTMRISSNINKSQIIKVTLGVLIIVILAIIIIILRKRKKN